MTRQEQLKAHCEKLTEIKGRLLTIQDEWRAYNKSFSAWLQAELGVADENREIHVSEILKIWEEKHDRTPKA